MNQDLSALFADISDMLQQYQALWRSVAFHDICLPWMDQYPALVRRLYALPPEQIEILATDALALAEFMAADLPMVHELTKLTALPVLPMQLLPKVSPRFHAGIPGRKWQQVEAFASCVPQAPIPILEWCAGKSHLGFFLQQCGGNAVTALEWNAELVQYANTRAARDNVSLISHAVDVLTSAADGFVQASQQVVALHACGELHEHLLDVCMHAQVEQVHLAPCCYHKRQSATYIPLSAQGHSVDMVLTRDELHTAVMETSTAGATAQRQRKQLQMMRLGFDGLQRDVRGIDSFLSVPSLPARWARADFADFCQHCAQLNGIALPGTVDWQRYRQYGEQRFWQVSALDLVRFLFRRPLEIWLALDRALLLQEHGYGVQVGTFCPAEVTPRNILLQARRLQ